MLHPAKGIVIKCVRYGDTSVIAKIYTDKFGMQSYLINGVRKSKSGNRQALLQPLTLLTMMVYHRDGKNLQRIREMSFDYIFTKIPFEVLRSSIAMFITEVLSKTLREEEPNPEVFDFLSRSVKSLDQVQDGLGDFHLRFLAQLTRLLGFGPGNVWSDRNAFFDLEEGMFVADPPAHYHVVQNEDASTFSKLFSEARDSLPRPQRQRLLEQLLNYYKLHVEGFGNVRSYSILQSVLN